MNPELSFGWDESAPRYAIDAILGSGGMGEVRLALDRRIGREVAHKTIRPATGPSDAEQVRERFLWEACIQGQLEHPSIVPVYDLARSDSGELYFTMKRVRGRTLRGILDALRQGDVKTDAEFSPHKLLTAFQSVCLAVAFAHSRGIVHRDLKPENIMLGDFGEVYVLDWGVAKVLGERETPSMSVRPPSDRSETTAGSILGTLGYMGPDQLRASDAVDERADVYALGAILFEILTLERLHPGDAEAVVDSTFAGVDLRARLRALQRVLPEQLVETCELATADKSARLASARALHDHIERYLSHHRSVELRREMSIEHSTRAAEAAERTLAAPDARDERRRALQEAGRALALDPTNERAAQTIMKLLLTPPADPPTEVRHQLVDKGQLRGRHTTRIASLSYAALLMYVPVLLWMGVIDAALLGALIAAILLGVGYSFFLSTRRRLSDAAMLSAFCVNAVVVGATALALGPFVITTAFAGVTTLVIALHFERHRVLVTAIGCLAVFVPLVLEWVGVLPPSYQFVDGGMLIRARMVALAEAPTLALLMTTSVTTLAISALAGSQIRGELSNAELRLMVQAWQLEQLVPTATDRESDAPVRPILSSLAPTGPATATADTVAVDTPQHARCLREDEILDLVEGRASVSARRRMEEHIDACDTCRQLVSLLAQSTDRS